MGQLGGGSTWGNTLDAPSFSVKDLNVRPSSAAYSPENTGDVESCGPRETPAACVYKGDP